MSDSTRYGDHDEHDPSLRPGADDAAGSAWRRFEAYVPDVVKRGLVTGLGALFLTEEGVRSAMTDLKMPKEAVAFLVAQAERSKRELTQVLARELRAFLDDVDINGVLRRVLAGMTVEFRTQVRFFPTDDGQAPRVEFEWMDESVKHEAAAPAPRRRAKAASRSKTGSKTGRRRASAPSREKKT